MGDENVILFGVRYLVNCYGWLSVYWICKLYFIYMIGEVNFDVFLENFIV